MSNVDSLSGLMNNPLTGLIFFKMSKLYMYWSNAFSRPWTSEFQEFGLNGARTGVCKHMVVFIGTDGLDCCDCPQRGWALFASHHWQRCHYDLGECEACQQRTRIHLPPCWPRVRSSTQQSSDLLAEMSSMSVIIFEIYVRTWWLCRVSLPTEECPWLTRLRTICRLI